MPPFITVLTVNDFLIQRSLKKCKCLRHLRKGDVSKFRNTFFLPWNLLLDLDAPTPCSLPGLPLLSRSITQGLKPHPVPKFSLPQSLPWPSLSLTPHLLPLMFLSVFHVPLPQSTKNFISRVCGAVCRGSYGASCIINDNSATHVFC